jgi:hypothetical protein
MLNFLKEFLLNYIDDFDSLLNHIFDDKNIMDDLDSKDSGSNEESSSELDSDSNTDNEDFFNYIIGIIASIFRYGSNDGGDSSTGSSLPADSVGDSLPGDSGIENRVGNSWFYSFLSKFLWVVHKMILKQLHDLGGTSIEYILSFINHMCDFIGYITIWSINHWGVSLLTEICLYYLIRYIRNVIAQIKASNQTDYTIMYNISAYNLARVSQIAQNLHESDGWNNLQEVNNYWTSKENHPYIKSCFKTLISKCGLTYMGDISINATEIGRRIQSLLEERVACCAITQVRTCIFHKSNKKFVWGIFNILVLLGIGVVVWYRYVPSDYSPAYWIPPEIAEPLVNFNAFKNPDAVIDGYKRVTFLINKDIMNTVITTFKQDPTFTEVFNLNEANDLDNNIITKHVFASAATAIMVASFIATKALVLPT